MMCCSLLQCSCVSSQCLLVIVSVSGIIQLLLLVCCGGLMYSVLFRLWCCGLVYSGSCRLFVLVVSGWLWLLSMMMLCSLVCWCSMLLMEVFIKVGVCMGILWNILVVLVVMLDMVCFRLCSLSVSRCLLFIVSVWFWCCVVFRWWWQLLISMRVRLVISRMFSSILFQVMVCSGWVNVCFSVGIGGCFLCSWLVLCVNEFFMFLILMVGGCYF